MVDFIVGDNRLFIGVDTSNITLSGLTGVPTIYKNNNTKLTNLVLGREFNTKVYNHKCCI